LAEGLDGFLFLRTDCVVKIFTNFWVVTPCIDVVGYQRFGGPCCLHLHGEVIRGFGSGHKYRMRSIRGGVIPSWPIGSEIKKCPYGHLTAQLHNAESHDLNLHRRENLGFRTFTYCVEGKAIQMNSIKRN
jgi:hypothetical protein